MAPSRDQVEALLGASVLGWRRLEPWAVARATLEDRSVIVKWLRPHADRSRASSWQLRTEVAALTFLSDDLGLELAPRVVAADLARGLVALEDLAPRVALDQLLRADGAAPHAERLAAFASARGRLNAATAGHTDTYYARLGRTQDVRLRREQVGLGRHREQGVAHAETIGAPIEGETERELAAALEELASPGPFLALSNGDAEANNVLLHPDGPPDARLIDFEFAGYAHALTDAVCLHVPGPAWLSVDGTGADDYRRALARGVPEAEDDGRYHYGLAAACVEWALARMGRFPLLDARPPGDDSRLQLVMTLEATAATAGALGHLSGWARHVADLLRRRWPDADRTAGPPYTVRGRHATSGVAPAPHQPASQLR